MNQAGKHKPEAAGACDPLAPLAPGAGLAIAAICFIFFGHGFWTANLPMPADLFPGHEVETWRGFGEGLGDRGDGG